MKSWTHCCFCGQQCGINLKVKDNRVIGFEPREDFPFNRGKLCPKGVKRYMQNDHPDRLLHPLRRSTDGFRQISWEEALDAAAAGLAPARDLDTSKSFGMFSCSKASNEMNYLAGKFTRQVMGSNNVDSCNRT